MVCVITEHKEGGKKQIYILYTSSSLYDYEVEIQRYFASETVGEPFINPQLCRRKTNAGSRHEYSWQSSAIDCKIINERRISPSGLLGPLHSFGLKSFARDVSPTAIIIQST